MTNHDTIAELSTDQLDEVHGGGFGDWLKRNAHNVMLYANPVTAPAKLQYETGKWAFNTTYNAGYNRGVAC